jgi:hypothetical protein
VEVEVSPGERLAILTDQVAICRTYRLSLQAAAFRHERRDPSFAAILLAASEVAGELATEAEAVAIFVWANRGTEPVEA